MSTLTSTQRSQLHEVADGMLKVYQTLVRMRYLEASWICEGPHALTDHELYEELGLDVAIIYLYSILPYIDTQDRERRWSTNQVGFFQGSYFADFRLAENVRDNRTPTYDDPLRPWMTTLCIEGNHSTVLVYDAHRHTIAITDQMCSGSGDRNIDELWNGQQSEHSEANEEDANEVPEQDAELEGAGQGQPDDQGDEPDQEDEEIDEGYNSDEDDWLDDGEQSEEEENMWDIIQARQANRVLEDLVSWYEDLTEVPEGWNTSVEWEEEMLRPIYVKHGWPSGDFDGDAFLVDHIRAVAGQRADFDFEDTQARVNRGVSATQVSRQGIEKPEPDRTIDEEWLAKLNTLSYDVQSRARGAAELVRCEAELARISAFDPQVSKLRQEYEAVLESALGAHEIVEDTLRRVRDIEESGDIDQELGRARSRLSYVQDRAELHDRAHDACRNDLRAFGPGDYHHKVLEDQVASVTKTKEWLQTLNDFVSELPSQDVEQARQKALMFIAGSQKTLQRETAKLAKLRSLVGEAE